MTNPLNTIYNNIQKTNELSNKFKLKIRDLKYKLGGVSKNNIKTKKLKNKKSKKLKKSKNLKKSKTLNTKPLQRANNILKNYYRQKYSS